MFKKRKQTKIGKKKGGFTRKKKKKEGNRGGWGEKEKKCNKHKFLTFFFQNPFRIVSQDSSK